MKRVLIANRAEIASRVIRATRGLGMESVAVYSDADAHLPYVREADHALRIGPADAQRSYLDAGAILAAARESGADAIHPGYGFLSENRAFAAAVNEAGLIFIGPTVAAMDALGSKTAAKAVAAAAQVPVVPWFAVTDARDATSRAQKIGYPVMLKPSSGGGGKGMYRCENDEELVRAIERASREAQAAFGSSSLLVEKFLLNPRHVEVQILADSHGHVLHLFDRECSIQRRNQKLIEESPSVALDAEQRSRLCADAVRIATEAGYLGAGTCEFLYDPAARRWYFCEMNTRLQVEHPVTEATTGIDIVQMQLRIARGEALGFTQADLRLSGHAMEFRIIAEDPFEGFAPSVGHLAHFALVRGEDVRNDAGFAAGNEVTPWYDSLLAKTIVHGRDRASTIARAREVLRGAMVLGIQTCIPFHLAMLEDEGFCRGDFHIHYAQARMEQGLVRRERGEQAALVAALMSYRREMKTRSAFVRGGAMSAWSSSALPRVRS